MAASFPIFSRLVLKDKPISSYQDATEEEMQELHSYLSGVDPAITRGDKSKKCLSNRPKLKEFIDHCCRERKYMFAIKKCGKPACNICKPVKMSTEFFNSLNHLPDPTPADSEHYKTFSDLYSTLTTEKHRPTLVKDIKKGPFTPNARETLLCVERLKPRVVYAQYRLTLSEEQAAMDGIWFTCGSSLKEVEVDKELKPLFDRVFVRQNLGCDDPVEIPYYSSELFQILCACKCTNTEPGKYPICKLCLEEGKVAMLKRKTVSSHSLYVYEACSVIYMWCVCVCCC